MADDTIGFLLLEARECRIRAGRSTDENLKRRWIDVAREYEARAAELQGTPPPSAFQEQPTQQQQQKKKDE
jgi:hypothetical protein